MVKLIFVLHNPPTDIIAYEEEILTLDHFDLNGKTVGLRVDFNSPLDPETGRILDDHRIRSHIPTISELEGAKLVIIAHQSRPGKKDYIPLKVHAQRLNKLIRRKVEYIDGLFDSRVKKKIKDMENGDILFLENARFYAEETYLKGKPDISTHENSHIVKNLAPLFDYYIHDAFAAAHRAQPTLVGFAGLIPTLAGRVMEKEIVDMGKAFNEDLENKIILLGGMKVDDSLMIASHMLQDETMDRILTTGVVGNIFLMAEGYDLGEGNRKFLERELSDYEEWVEKAKELLKDHREKIGIPLDVVINKNGKRKGAPLDELPSEHPIFDIGLDTIVNYKAIIEDSDLVVINGPAGAFEIDEFSIGTRELFRAVAESDSFSIIGGGHSTAVVEKLDLTNKIDHISTGGGSCINFLAGREMPGIEALKRSKKKYYK
ncbi:MAG: phosphoglycerate kinase [Candidatus Saliniplasma sp.]